MPVQLPRWLRAKKTPITEPSAIQEQARRVSEQAAKLEKLVADWTNTPPQIQRTTP